MVERDTNIGLDMTGRETEVGRQTDDGIEVEKGGETVYVTPKEVKGTDSIDDLEDGWIGAKTAELVHQYSRVTKDMFTQNEWRAIATKESAKELSYPQIAERIGSSESHVDRSLQKWKCYCVEDSREVYGLFNDLSEARRRMIAERVRHPDISKTAIGEAIGSSTQYTSQTLTIYKGLVEALNEYGLPASAPEAVEIGDPDQSKSSSPEPTETVDESDGGSPPSDRYKIAFALMRDELERRENEARTELDNIHNESPARDAAARKLATLESLDVYMDDLIELAEGQ